MSNRAPVSLRSLVLAAQLCAGAWLFAHVPTAASAQEEVTAATVAAWAQRFYDQTTTVEGRFSQYFWNRVYERTQTSRGTVSISRPGRVRFDYAAPSGKVVVSDGTNFTYFEPGDDGAAGQWYRGSADSTSAALGFLTGTARLDRDFRFTLRPQSASQPPSTRALELTPRRPDPHYRRVILYVSEPEATRGAVMRVSIEDPDGNWNRFDFQHLQFNHAIEASRFEYTPPAGSREITPPS